MSTEVLGMISRESKAVLFFLISLSQVTISSLYPHCVSFRLSPVCCKNVAEILSAVLLSNAARGLQLI
jgi:hypothetical protein